MSAKSEPVSAPCCGVLARHKGGAAPGAGPPSDAARDGLRSASRPTAAVARCPGLLPGPRGRADRQLLLPRWNAVANAATAPGAGPAAASAKFEKRGLPLQASFQRPTRLPPPPSSLTALPRVRQVRLDRRPGGRPAGGAGRHVAVRGGAARRPRRHPGRL